MSSKLDFYKTSREGSIALTKLAKESPKARLLIDWVSMILINRNTTTNAVMVSNEVLQDIMGCSVNTVTKAVKAANDAKLLGVSRVGNSRIYYLNPKVIKMDRVDDKYYAFDVAVVIDKEDSIYQSISDNSLSKTFGIARNGSMGGDVR